MAYHDAHVLILIDKESRCWIVDAVDNNFVPHEAKLIKSIPISIIEADDKLCWSSNMVGIYLVKAGYRLLVNEELNSPVGTSNMPQPKNTWKLRISNRTKTLMWRAIKDALPTRANLVRRKVLTNPTCQVCEAESESTLLALWSCLKLKEVKAVHFVSLRNEACECLTFLEVFTTCLEKAHHMDLFAMLAY